LSGCGRKTDAPDPYVTTAPTATAARAHPVEHTTGTLTRAFLTHKSWLGLSTSKFGPETDLITYEVKTPTGVKRFEQEYIPTEPRKPRLDSNGCVPPEVAMYIDGVLVKAPITIPAYGSKVQVDHHGTLLYRITAPKAE
jgi:hypothetical protein